MADKLSLVISPDMNDGLIASVVRESDGMRLNSWRTILRELGTDEAARKDFDETIDDELIDSRFVRAGNTDWTRMYAPVVPLQYISIQGVNTPQAEIREVNKRQLGLTAQWQPYLTVGELRQILDDARSLAEHTPVLMYSGGDWHYVNGYNLPGDDGYDDVLSLHPGDGYDSRNH